ncbi:hypothetical protein AOLI_G00165680 [Acnodon oligacanthus]
MPAITVCRDRSRGSGLRFHVNAAKAKRRSANLSLRNMQNTDTDSGINQHLLSTERAIRRNTEKIDTQQTVQRRRGVASVCAALGVPNNRELHRIFFVDVGRKPDGAQGSERTQNTHGSVTNTGYEPLIHAPRILSVISPYQTPSDHSTVTKRTAPERA